MFFLPSQSLVAGLRADGVPATAEVISATTDKYGDVGNVRVRFTGPEGQVETGLQQWAGKLPDGLRQGAGIAVTYDPADPGQVMTTAWVRNPPGMTMPMIVTLFFAPLLLLAAILITLRRRRLAKEYARLDAA